MNITFNTTIYVQYRQNHWFLLSMIKAERLWPVKLWRYLSDMRPAVDHVLSELTALAWMASTLLAMGARMGNDLWFCFHHWRTLKFSSFVGYGIWTKRSTSAFASAAAEAWVARVSESSSESSESESIRKDWSVIFFFLAGGGAVGSEVWATGAGIADRRVLEASCFLASSNNNADISLTIL